jgi:hypothetical protein
MWYAALLGALLSIIGSLVGKVLVSLGIGYVTYKGLDTAITYAKAQIFASLGGLSPVTLQVLGLLQVGTAINILISALVVRMTLKGMTSGAVKAMTLK